MNLASVKLVYFSPTKTTKSILEHIAKGLQAEQVEVIDGTRPDVRSGDIPAFGNELVILGAPVYAGRLPATAATWFKSLTARKTPVIPVVVYGNRAYGDALLELSDIAESAGCIPVAAGAFIGEHSFSTEGLPIALDRPDAADLAAAREFGENIRNKFLQAETVNAMDTPNIPGNTPYKAVNPFPELAPVTHTDLCTSCGTCASVCPTGAVSENGLTETDAKKCLFCCACIKACPARAREFQGEFISSIANKLHQGCRERREPEMFL